MSAALGFPAEFSSYAPSHETHPQNGSEGRKLAAPAGVVKVGDNRTLEQPVAY